MFVMGRYYAPVGTGPQDGEHSDVYKVLTLAAEIVKERATECDEDED